MKLGEGIFINRTLPKDGDGFFYLEYIDWNWEKEWWIYAKVYFHCDLFEVKL